MELARVREALEVPPPLEPQSMAPAEQAQAKVEPRLSEEQ